MSTADTLAHVDKAPDAGLLVDAVAEGFAPCHILLPKFAVLLSFPVKAEDRFPDVRRSDLQEVVGFPCRILSGGIVIDPEQMPGGKCRICHALEIRVGVWNVPVP